MVIAVFCSLISIFFLVSQTLFHRAMLNDERDYPDPHEFKPERYLKNGKLDSSVRDPMDIAFGFGRRWVIYITSPYFFVFCPSHRRSCRVCPGRHLAHSIVTLAAASVLSTFDLVRKVDENGREIEPKREYTTAGIRWVTFPVFALLVFTKCHL